MLSRILTCYLESSFPPGNMFNSTEIGYLTQDKCENPAGLFFELESYPMHQWVNCIEGKHFIIPDLNIGLQGSKPPGEVKKNIFSSGVDGSKSHLSLWRKAVIFARTAGIYLVPLPNFWSK